MFEHSWDKLSVADKILTEIDLYIGQKNTHKQKTQLLWLQKLSDLALCSSCSSRACSLFPLSLNSLAKLKSSSSCFFLAAFLHWSQIHKNVIALTQNINWNLKCILVDIHSVTWSSLNFLLKHTHVLLSQTFVL